MVAVAVAATVIVYALSGYSNPQMYPNDYGLYVYLFKFNPSLEEHAYLEYMRPLYDEIYNTTKITKPTFEEIHYSVSRNGVYRNILTNETIDRLMPVKFIVSDSIEKPDGSPMKEDDILPDTRFYYSGLGTARLIIDENGRVHSYTQEFPPTDLENAAGDQRVFTLFVQDSDYQMLSSKYYKVNSFIESFELRDNG
jgi:hypothetical protein